ncbi:putative Cysteine/Histidine-rich C1 domain family protein [Hibiscus syriacus]|uniref:Cysteine/Histidine-rich C1 domain family protein n=1 Tax=Hibiscus syriacus TaxID=106335 RepID=A0A6A3BCJ7_HIBSY|nr:putative Cysteine/Histidine-rich C1 domain family protein [Hibiscus syriacus]
MEIEMGSQHFGHNHPMVFNDVLSNQTKEVTCSRCGEMMSGSSFSCSECEFYLHKKCAEAPLEIRHPYHHNHPLVLLPKPSCKGGRSICNFCGKTSEKFLYHCSCKLDLHVKCALLSFDIAKRKLEEPKRVPLEVPLVSAEDNDEELKRVKCFVCREPLVGSMQFSLDFHLTCAELPSTLSLLCHRKHPLILDSQIYPSCKACKETRGKVKVEYGSYSCSNCKFIVHVKCALEKGWYKVIEANRLDDLTMVPRSTNPIICVRRLLQD